MYDFQYIVRKVVQNYGPDIEKQDTLRAIIDDQFYKDTQPFFYVEFFLFVFTFMVPFLI
jgi:hypothetical protein